MSDDKPEVPRRNYEIRITWDTPHGASLELVGPGGMQPFASRGQAQAEDMRKACIEELAAPLIAAELRRLADEWTEHVDDEGGIEWILDLLRARADELDPPTASSR